MSTDRRVPIDPIEAHCRNWPETFDRRPMELLLALHRVRAAETEAIHGVIERHGISLAEFDVLTTLRRSPSPCAMTPKELQGQMIITSGGLTKILRQLEIRQLIDRSTEDADRRIKPAHLTQGGIRLIEQVMAELMDAARAWMQPVLNDPQDIDQLIRLLQRLLGPALR